VLPYLLQTSHCTSLVQTVDLDSKAERAKLSDGRSVERANQDDRTEDHVVLLLFNSLRLLLREIVDQAVDDVVRGSADVLNDRTDRLVVFLLETDLRVASRFQKGLLKCSQIRKFTEMEESRICLKSTNTNLASRKTGR
jgi:hypothetical protein